MNQSNLNSPHLTFPFFHLITSSLIFHFDISFNFSFSSHLFISSANLISSSNLTIQTSHLSISFHLPILSFHCTFSSNRLISFSSHLYSCNDFILILSSQYSRYQTMVASILRCIGTQSIQSLKCPQHHFLSLGIRLRVISPLPDRLIFQPTVYHYSQYIVELARRHK